MSFFAYRGRNAAGEAVQGVLEGADAGAVAAQLFVSGVTPVDIVPTDAPRSERGRQRLAGFTRDRVRHIDLVLFSRQMFTLLKAGVPIMQALAGLQESTDNRAFRAVLKRIREHLDAGRELSVALARQQPVFSPFYVAMVQVGERTGRLEEVFLRLFHHLEFQKFMREQVKSALRYPLFVLAAMAIALTIINVFVIPAFAKVYAGFKAELPTLTRFLIGFSDFMVSHWPWLLGGAIVAALAFQSLVRTPQGRHGWDRAKLGIPIAGKIVHKATMARFARSLSLALRSGVPVVQGLTLVAQVVDNDYVAGRVEKMRSSVERGESVLRAAIQAGIFTPVVLQMIKVGEDSGALDDLLQEIADMYQREVEYELKTLSAQIEPILIVGLGVLVLVLALGVFLPLWDLGAAALSR
ncbi:MAG: MSHA biogenesis protein MshG [Azospira oryzae]|nr:MAG: MSHA biogenesis protein MshG [Azospira oryzae]PZP81229.1 MAG: MSHA biogenesis protein MshG [Azospira oryzae]